MGPLHSCPYEGWLEFFVGMCTDPDVRLLAPFSAKTLCLLVNMNSLSPAGAAAAAGGDSRQSHALACGQGVPLSHRVLPLRRVCAAKDGAWLGA